ncbi:DUF2157 domain-containing protein [Aquimarina brevivitae]|uniref:Putative membrane protein n=1 Tax=Aquimarina brevivitae TaxID=323412 RepID=A0A4Q7NXP6_9FLAO|nr:DUF2157 domain-containing protein [Aquimarina brevivitae]RZS92166.1 putative membrane protein [Aquimarina brevivitae]
MRSKLSNELDTLIKEGVISSQTATDIRQYYAAKNENSPNLLYTIFGIFGAILIGAGIILMIAHNWDAFSKVTKIIWALSPLVLAQLLVGYTILKEKSMAWKESASVLLFFAVGTAISLISQIYHLPEQLDSYLLTWGLLCLPLVYLTKSRAVALLTLLTGTYYTIVIGWKLGESKTPWMYLIFIGAILPYYINLVRTYIASNTTTIFNWAIPISCIIGLSCFIKKADELGFLMYITLFAVFYGIGRLQIFAQSNTLRNGFLLLGSFGTIVVLLILTFWEVWKDIGNGHQLGSQEFFIALFLVIIALILSVQRLANSKLKLNATTLIQYSFLLIWMVFFIPLGYIFATVIINLLLLAIGITIIKSGIAKMHFRILNYGLLITSVLIISRFFDTTMSFELRGAVFVVIGLSFFVSNYLMYKRQLKISKK